MTIALPGQRDRLRKEGKGWFPLGYSKPAAVQSQFATTPNPSLPARRGCARAGGETRCRARCNRAFQCRSFPLLADRAPAIHGYRTTGATRSATQGGVRGGFRWGIQCRSFPLLADRAPAIHGYRTTGATRSAMQGGAGVVSAGGIQCPLQVNTKLKPPPTPPCRRGAGAHAQEGRHPSLSVRSDRRCYFTSWVIVTIATSSKSCAVRCARPPRRAKQPFGQH